MTDTTRPASGPSSLAAVAAMLSLVAAVTVGALALGSSTPAGAAGLERFASCEELQAWSDDLQEGFAAPDVGGAPLPTFAVEEGMGEAATAGADTASRDVSADATGGTNTVVAGVDEIDIIDRVGDNRLLVARNGVLALVGLADLRLLSQINGIPYDARISADDGVVFVAGTASDGSGIEVTRVRIEGDALVEDGRWTSSGYLIDARRTGDRLHVVAVDQPFGAIPFEGGPVPCDQVWRPTAPAITPAATLVATLPATGALAPIAATEVTGSAGNLLVTDASVYVATESWSADGAVTTGIHRFDVGSLAPTGSGSVPGSLAGPFALDEYAGTLRVATNAGSGGFVGRPMPVEGDVVIDDAAEASALVGPSAPVQEDPVADPSATTVPDDTTTSTVPDDTTTTTEPEPTTTTVPETTTTTAVETTTTTVVEDPAALAEVFVLDTDGDLDLLGRTGRFGHDFETIHGVRFVGDVAYVVTFRQTDPFWVVDLADATAPRVVGELQIPGFSGYLHPVGEGRVVGFGPDGTTGGVAARLFDVSDPAAPAVLDEVRLGDDSPIAFDHHAFVGLGDGRFAVPALDYADGYITDGECGPGVAGGPGVEPVAPTCETRPVGGGSGAVVLTVAGSRLSVIERAFVEGQDLYGERVVPAPDGDWIVVGWDRLVATDGSQLLLPSA